MKRSTLLHSLRVVGMAAGAGLAAQACASSNPDPTGSSSSMLGGADAGSGAEGGSASSGGSSGGGTTVEYIYIYIFKRQMADRHHLIGLTTGATETFDFAWHDAAGAAPPADLWIESNGKKILQVSAINHSPFLRSGLDIVPLTPEANYRVKFDRADDSVNVTVLDSADKVVMQTHTAAPVADVVLPSTFWRASVAADLR